MDNPCKNCDKANINKPTVLKCWKPCNKGKQYYECEKALIDMLTGKHIGIDKNDDQKLNIEEILNDVHGTNYIHCYSINFFESIPQLKEFVKVMNKNGVGVAIKSEYSNLFQGVYVELYDKELCTVKKYL